MSAAPTYLVFVYGLLLEGESAHKELEGTKFEGPAKTARKFALVDLDSYPALVAGGDTSVEGELYTCTPQQLARVDVFEEHPILFRRSPIELEDGREAQAYLLGWEQVRGRRRIRSGSWRRRFEKP